jgi:hypothetical protein
MHHAIALTSLLFVLTWGGARPAHAQQTQQKHLTEPDAVFPEPFSRIAGVRELSDGRVIIADRLEQHVSFVDFATGSLRQIGREGQGPGEYQTPLGLLALPNDESLLSDIGNMRITRIDREGRMGESMPMMREGQSYASFVRPAGSDSDGRVYYSDGGTVRLRGGQGAPELPDSTAVLRWDLAADATDTAAMLAAPTRNGGRAQSARMSSSGGRFQFSGMMLQPFSASDAWAVTPDGKVVVARADTYRLEIYELNGTKHAGPQIDYKPVRITKAEKEAWADRQSQQTVAFRMAGGGGRTMEMPRPDIDDVEFPEAMPPFGANAALATPFGEIWVRRSQPSREKRPLFDVFDERGERITQLRLSENTEVVGFGKQSVYTVRTDEDDLQWLERYRYAGPT